MITEDYASFEIAKLLREEGFDETVRCFYDIRTEILCDDCVKTKNSYTESIAAPTLQMTVKWIQETFNIVIIPNYEYEYDSTPWCYEIFKLEENGKPEGVAVKGVSYDKDNNPTEHIVGYRDYERSYKDYATKEEAIEEGIKYCLENLI